jgi:hypothetical protein
MAELNTPLTTIGEEAACCGPAEQGSCCAPSDKATCCEPGHPDGCGCAAGQSAHRYS